VECFKKCVACQGRYFKKETVTAHSQGSDSESQDESTKFSSVPRVLNSLILFLKRVTSAIARHVRI
jgi:hypothetical protein